MQKNKLLYGILVAVLSFNTFMMCVNTFRSIGDRDTLNIMQSEIKELKRLIDIEIKLRQEIFPEIKKSASLLNDYNQELDQHTALSYALKIWQCSDEFVPHDLLTALIVVESGARHNAVSPMGALGLTQIMPQFWPYDEQELQNPYRNIELGAEILRQHIKQNGIVGGLRAYNGGAYYKHIDGTMVYARKVLETAGSYF